jgi:hypothetical protein
MIRPHDPAFVYRGAGGLVQIKSRRFPRQISFVEKDLIVHFTLPDEKTNTWSTEFITRTMLCYDTGAPTTVAGVYQTKQACQKLNVPNVLQSSMRSFRFGDTRRKSLGISRKPIPTPTRTCELAINVVDLDVPTLLVLDSLDAMNAYLNTVDNTLVGSNWSLPLVRKTGHVYLPVPALDYYFSRTELRKLHRAFYHPSAAKLYQLIRQAKPDDSGKHTFEVLEEISRSCDACQRISRKPVNFAVGGTEEEEIRFNRVLLLDLMHLSTPRGTKPILHVMDRDTRFHAARFLPSASASAVWETLGRVLDVFWDSNIASGRSGITAAI